ncbi:MAG: Helix-turn-helix domain [Acidobacteriaceae bacterium]|jgi:transcriptional regulator with XRE-family HTH domain|nr:Helix-turn-helix domain [Acidobacteriaceae bacterium]MEA2257813.1 Helix-turn-helix domain [Acidobacteriaceae bacterium]MEA2543364.1 Helix-turn-helix domain [Acidobacteriaceae bacterium]
MTREKPTSLTLRLGAKISKLRKSKGWTQKQVEEMAGFHQGYVSRIENGLLQPELEGLAVLAKVFGLNLSRLLSGIDDEVSL